MDLFINTDAADPRRALAAALDQALSEVPFPPVSFGNTLDLVVYLITDKGAYHDDAGSGALTCAMTIGPKDDASLVTSPTFTAGAGTSQKGFSASLPLTEDSLAMVLGASRAPLVLTFSTTKAGKKTTWLTTEITILGSIV